MSTARRVTAVAFSVMTGLAGLWVALGWLSIGMNGASWSDGLAMLLFSVVLALLSLVCATLWGSRVRAASYAFLMLFSLSAVSLFASMTL